MSNIEQMLNERIAENLGLQPEQIILEFIQDYRQKNPDEHFEQAEPLPGWSPERKIVSRIERIVESARAEHFLKQFADKA